MGHRKGPGKKAAQERAVEAKEGAGLEKGRKEENRFKLKRSLRALDI
jgi:hypothetical protein